MQAWFVIEDAGEEGEVPQVCSWQLDKEAALEDAKTKAEANHDRVYLLVAVEEGVDPITCINAETLCVWYQGRVYDSGTVIGGELRLAEVGSREAEREGRGRPHNLTL